MQLPTNPCLPSPLWVWLGLLLTSQSAYQFLGKGEKKRACWCCTGILLEGENEKRRKPSCLRYIYTIGCKSFLMGSRVQSWGRDYQGKSGYGVTCIWPGLTPRRPAQLHSRLPGHEWSPGEEDGIEVRVAWLARGGRKVKLKHFMFIL